MNCWRASCLFGDGWSHTGRNLSSFLSFSPPLVFSWETLDAYDCFLLLVVQHPVWIPFVFLHSLQRPRLVRHDYSSITPESFAAFPPSWSSLSRHGDGPWRQVLTMHAMHAMHLMHTYQATEKRAASHDLQSHPILAYMYIYCSCMRECMRMGKVLPFP
jgi:hypothetical protein